MTRRIHNKELSQPDAFMSTSDHVFAWIEKHRASVGMLIAAVTLLTVAWIGYGYMQARSEAKAADALFAAENQLKQAEKTVRDERAKALQEKAGLSAKDKDKSKTKKSPEDLANVRPADYAKDYAPAVRAIRERIQENSGTKAALVSAMSLASFLIEEKQYSEALEVVNLPRFQPSTDDLLGGFWLMHKGLVLIENKKFDEAQKAYQAILDSKTLAAFHPEAMLKLGLSQDLKGEKDKARQTYEKLNRDFPRSEASSSAQQYLRFLELKSQPG